MCVYIYIYNIYVHSYFGRVIEQTEKHISMIQYYIGEDGRPTPLGLAAEGGGAPVKNTYTTTTLITLTIIMHVYINKYIYIYMYTHNDDDHTNDSNNNVHYDYD